MNNQGKRVLIYSRVSTKEQDPEMQLRDLRNYVAARRLNLVNEYVDYASGSKNNRVNYQKMLDDIRKRKVDIVLVWRIDRAGRSVKELISLLEECRGLGVDFISYQENIDTSSPAGKVLFTMVSAFAEFEREIIRERVIAGLNKAKDEGKRLGRPKISSTTITEIKRLREKGVHYSKIIKRVGISRAKYFQIVKEYL